MNIEREIQIAVNIKPLSINQAFQGRRFKTKAYTKYCHDVACLLTDRQYDEMIKGYVEIHYKFYLKNWKMTDGDNCVKCLQDQLVSRGLIQDDRFIMKYVIEKIPSKIDKIEIIVKSLKGEMK